VDKYIKILIREGGMKKNNFRKEQKKGTIDIASLKI